MWILKIDLLEVELLIAVKPENVAPVGNGLHMLKPEPNKYVETWTHYHFLPSQDW